MNMTMKCKNPKHLDRPPHQLKGDRCQIVADAQDLNRGIIQTSTCWIQNNNCLQTQFKLNKWRWSTLEGRKERQHNSTNQAHFLAIYATTKTSPDRVMVR